MSKRHKAFVVPVASAAWSLPAEAQLLLVRLARRTASVPPSRRVAGTVRASAVREEAVAFGAGDRWRALLEALERSGLLERVGNGWSLREPWGQVICQVGAKRYEGSESPEPCDGADLGAGDMKVGGEVICQVTPAEQPETPKCRQPPATEQRSTQRRRSASPEMVTREEEPKDTSATEATDAGEDGRLINLLSSQNRNNVERPTKRIAQNAAEVQPQRDAGEGGEEGGSAPQETTKRAPEVALREGRGSGVEGEPQEQESPAAGGRGRVRGRLRGQVSLLGDERGEELARFWEALGLEPFTRLKDAYDTAAMVVLAYPRINHESISRRIAAWWAANPERRPKRNVRRFVDAWFSREAGRAAEGPQQERARNDRGATTDTQASRSDVIWGPRKEEP